jgi:hypothetical protein
VPRKLRDWTKDKPVSEWDLEELRRGQRRNARGNFTGRPPTTGVITREIHEELWRRIMSEAAQRLRDGVPHALEGIMSIARDEEMPGAVRLNAFMYWVDRVYGKPTQPLAHAVVAQRESQPLAPWEAAVAAFITQPLEPEQIIAAQAVLGRGEGGDPAVREAAERNRAIIGTSRPAADDPDDEREMADIIEELG